MSLYTWLKNWWNNIDKCDHEFSVRHTNHATCKCGKRKSHYYGWNKPKGTTTAKSFGDSGEVVVTVIPDTIDLRSKCPPIRNQGSQGSCTGFSSASAVTFQRMAQGELPNPPGDMQVASPEYIYSLTRKTEGTFPSDVGASIADTVVTIEQEGSCAELYMVYDQNIYNQLPSALAIADGQKKKAIQYSVINNNDLNLVDLALSNGYTVLIGITVYSSFEGPIPASNGIIPYPNMQTESVLGGHAIEIIGKIPVPGIPNKRRYPFKNSWGPSWGDKGYGYLDEDYLKNPNLSSDWHVIKLMS